MAYPLCEGCHITAFFLPHFYLPPNFQNKIQPSVIIQQCWKCFLMYPPCDGCHLFFGRLEVSSTTLLPSTKLSLCKLDTAFCDQSILFTMTFCVILLMKNVLYILESVFPSTKLSIYIVVERSVISIYCWEGHFVAYLSCERCHLYSGEQLSGFSTTLYPSTKLSICILWYSILYWNQQC